MFALCVLLLVTYVLWPAHIPVDITQFPRKYKDDKVSVPCTLASLVSLARLSRGEERVWCNYWCFIWEVISAKIRNRIGPSFF